MPLFAFLLAMAASGTTALLWILGNPAIAGWDELAYIDEVQHDLIVLAQGGWGALRDTLFMEYRTKPPGTRLLALPAALAGFGDATWLRLLSLLAIGLAAALTGLAAAAVAGPGAGLLAAAAFLVAPASVRAGQEFMTETLTIPALAATLWCLAREWARPDPPAGNAVLLGLAVGAGLLGRFSFAVQLAPAAVLALGLGLLFDRRRARRLGIAAFVALLLAWPFYVVNGARYVGYARGAMAEWQGHRLIAGEGEFLARWLGRILVDFTLGPLLAVVTGLGLLGLLVLAARRVRWGQPPPALIAAGFALALVAPVIAGHLIGQNQNFRFLAATVPGLAIAAAIGVAAGLPRIALRLSAGLLGLHAMLVAGAALLPPRPGLSGLRELQARPNLACDWHGLVQHVSAAGTPRLLLLGFNDGFNPVQVAHAFHRQGRRIAWQERRQSEDAAPLKPLLDAADLVVLLVEGEPEQLPPGLYHPPQHPPVLRLPADPASLSPGLEDRGELNAPGAGRCRARLYGRVTEPR